ncbi:DUF3558 family protein [Saccharothrix variisporea]|uniref:Uncharacterized protein DUF3558 n=1 Tax=Saccharothrix variisporea TaxID=543527 RepID=A0A495X0V9_9PSEU|nr:DUF3558 family protein [Saccharothrix variisporea]RKT67550.1 uncharacterized protein DUF3558 [Saccharothrix variisporea]
MIKRVVGVVLVAIALCACTTQVTGTPTPVPNPTSPPKPRLAAEDLLGDLAAVDPCGFVQARDLEEFGEVVAGARESLDSCLLTVTTKGGAELDVTFGTLEQLESESELKGAVEEYRDLRIAEDSQDATRCARRIVFEDLVTLAVSVDNYSSGSAPHQDLCKLVDHATETTADAVLAKEVEHWKYPAKSVGRLDACEAARTSLAQVPGLATPKARVYPARHQCRWSNDGTSSTPRARVTYAVGTPATPDGANAVREDVGGRPTVITRSSAASVAFCAAETTHIAFEGGVQELVFVTVSLPSGTPVDQACAAAKAVATEAWATLPK